ncbi:hypothetical protein [Streptomyces aquilus]|uniref:hypothetical protein n=1 Tax=Streptomyces aquilus TaxID=2548456 RepID=UPI001AD8286F|nr:hypothetical protein [Streptomyces aquilus]
MDSSVALLGGGSVESPAMVKVGGTYYMLGSHLTDWSLNDNVYATATSPSGPWSAWKDLAAPAPRRTRARRPTSSWSVDSEVPSAGTYTPTNRASSMLLDVSRASISNGSGGPGERRQCQCRQRALDPVLTC